MKTFVVCSKCGKVEEIDKAKDSGWLIAQRLGKPQGHMIIRCNQHITNYARRSCGLPRLR